MGTFVVVAIIVITLFFAVRRMIKNKKNGKSICCGGDCSKCGGCH